ncbi:MAG TPA: alpha/beta hydrolase [Ottowia sp.]|uniref:alpha/beta fold hydrolase n=1 Tax=Ottowia sp. TaxID=1898956 RepID=UPI002CCD9960|nr:alpha/beta hydrolase [Ottowia sp.]HMN20168.1 alpha/beta hydrolase [Ottowia sp.]
MSDPTLCHLACPDPGGEHRMAWWQWGDARAPHAVLCVHGLTRQGRDFDVLARALLARTQARGRSLRVICPDVVGRGRSDWLRDPAGYDYPLYVADLLTLLGQLHEQAPLAGFDWVGTSMGGIIGMTLAGMSGLPLPAPLGRLLLNDVGPRIEWPAIAQMRDYVGRAPDFDTLQAGVAYLRTLSQGFGPCSDADWLDFSRPMLRQGADGRWRLHYDPAIAAPMAGLTPAALAQAEQLLWRLYDQITAETLLLHGAESDLLSAATAHAMTQRGPRARCIQIRGVGHAPMLRDPDQVQCVLDFLLPPAAREGQP